MRPDLLIMVISVMLSVSFGSVAATPVPMSDTFEAGDPLTEKEFSYNISSKVAGKGIESNDFMPWNKQNPELFEGDIMQSKTKNANLNGRWPNGRIPYIISASYNSAQRQVIAFAMNEFHKRTCIRFVSRTNSDPHYIRILPTGQGCSSYIGRIGGSQDVSLDSGCISNLSPGTVMHELMHSAGFWHEHTRPDRDRYVSINLSNVNPSYRFNFNKMSSAQVTTLGLSYDYGSVMHYPKNAFAMNPSVPVIKALIGNPTIGQRSAFSALDVQKLNKLYGCVGK
ncbi:zinc metalloproteinase nas-13-like [Daphnia pulicaria]|uniref:zinc metalloproteinase nas-13-like n=1 Tax=Daphnia pulicaria TaxID=35523 RepID=UPI001EEC6269|nr:zinc metalloproteinase nas-13-like [Daphnia pulicaria]